MKTKKWIIITAMVLCLMFGSLHANAQNNKQSDQRQSRNQGQGSSDQGRMRHPPHPVMTALDADRDHVISAAEIAGAAKALLTLDKNGDGILTIDEVRPQRRGGNRMQKSGKGNQGQQSGNLMQGQGGNQGQSGNRMQGQSRNRRQPPTLPAMKALDTDNNKQLSASEIANASKALLTLDKNGDGKLSHDEVRPKPPTRRQQNKKK